MPFGPSPRRLDFMLKLGLFRRLGRGTTHFLGLLMCLLLVHAHLYICRQVLLFSGNLMLKSVKVTKPRAHIPQNRGAVGQDSSHTQSRYIFDYNQDGPFPFFRSEPDEVIELSHVSRSCGLHQSDAKE